MNSGVRWVFDLLSWKPTAVELLQALSAVQSEELSRIERFVFRRDALASLAGRLLIRAYCCLATGLSWDKITLLRDDNNKPYLKDHDHIKFNVSHQGKYVVLAGETGNFQLGVDVMKQEYTGGKRVDEFFRLMHRSFSPKEWSTILSSPEVHNQIRYFYRFWTLKESYVKATGTGITVPLDKISFTLSSFNLPLNEFSIDTKVYVDGSVQRDWLFQEAQLDSNHCVSVAMSSSREMDSNESSPISFTQVSINDLLNRYGFLPLTNVDLRRAQMFLDKPYSPQ